MKNKSLQSSDLHFQRKYHRVSSNLCVKLKKPEGVLTVSHSRVDVRALALPTGLFPLLITDFAFCTLVAEDLNLAECAVDGFITAVVVAVGVDL